MDKNTFIRELENEVRELPAFIRTIHPLSDELTYYAASLSFYTLFAIIPLFWITFSVFSRMPVFDGYYDQMKEVAMSFVVPGQSEQVISYLDSFLSNASHMGWIGLVYVFFTSVLFFSNYTDIVNRIFNVPNRKLSYSLMGFVTVLVVAPFVLGASLIVSSQLVVVFDIQQNLIWINYLFSFVLLCLFFYSIYRFSPNTHIDTMPALFSAIVVAVMWQLAKNIFVYYIVINRAYTTIYGSFSLLLFTMLWIYLSWVLCLYGFKLCYHLQYCRDSKLS